MRKHNKKRINIKKLLFFSLLSFTVVLALFFGVKRIYSYFQDKEYQEKIEALISKEEKNYASNTEKKSRQEGSHYIESFYPLRDGQVNSIVKEMMDADSKTIKNGQKKDRKIDQLTFYYSEEKDTSLTDVKEVLVHRKDYQAKNRKISPAETRQIAWNYLGSDGNRFTLDKVFQDAEVAKEVLLSETSSQLTFRQIDEAAQTEVLNSMSASDLSQWNFRYENSHFSISLPKEIQGLTSLEVPLSSLYNQINPSYLKGADLEAYQNYESKRHEKMVALTFDDGPDAKTTPQALDILKKYGVKATFFMLGQNVVSNPDIVKRVKNEGHQIGIHTWDHPVLTKLPMETVKKEIFDIKPTITRPPYGAINSMIQNAIDQSFIMWNVDSLDWKTRNTKAIMQEVAKTQPGSIILMHDIHQTSIDALPSVIQYLQNNGYTLVTVDELLGGQLEPHRIYYSRD